MGSLATDLQSKVFTGSNLNFQSLRDASKEAGSLLERANINLANATATGDTSKVDAAKELLQQAKTRHDTLQAISELFTRTLKGIIDSIRSLGR